ncbi:MAG: trypsin-like peptidase domain-containing protein [Nitrososphaera sp.]|jgi:S1-C subfamily serine protease
MNIREKILLIIIGVLSATLVTGFTTNFGSVYPDSKIVGESESTQTKVVQISNEPLTDDKVQEALLTIDTQTKSPLTTIFKKVENSVVQITSKVSTINPYIIINGMPLESQSTRLGSGFVYDAEGHIITNHHVIADAKEVDVRFVDGNIYSAKVIGSDPFNDIAVLQIIDDFSEEHVVPLKIGDSSELEVGQQVIAIGNPFGLSNTMTTGIVSQIGRLLPNTESGFSIPNVIQTDAAINPGNSGGPMLNLQGYVIGINTAIQSKTGEFSGIGFAVPSNTIKKIVPSLIEKGRYEHPWLGVAGTSLTPDITKQLGLPKNYKGVLVTTVVDGGPAQKAGLQEATYSANGGLKGGDIIIALDGHQIRDMDDLIIYIADNKKVGDSVLLQINRNGETVGLTATLQARPTN